MPSIWLVVEPQLPVLQPPLFAAAFSMTGRSMLFSLSGWGQHRFSNRHAMPRARLTH
jgi:hypothetical protein